MASADPVGRIHCKGWKYNTILLLYGALAVTASIFWLYAQKSDTIPAFAGFTSLISSWVAALHFFFYGIDVISEGYSQHRNGVFRVPMLFRWHYVVSGRKRVQELASAPDHLLDIQEALEDSFHISQTVGPQAVRNPYHILAIRGGLTRNLDRCFPQLQDEIVHAFDHVLGLKDKNWKLFGAMSIAMQVTTRTSNRLFVGLPLCRDPEYLQLNIDYPLAIFARGRIIDLIPNFLRSILAPLISTRKSTLRRALKLMGPLIDERLENEKQYGGDWPGRPNDLISWLLDFAEGEERTTPALASRVLLTNFPALLPASATLTSALYDLASQPDYILPMRDEVERVVAEEGWTKAAIGKMHKVDSFLRESQRLHGVEPLTLGRKVVAPEGFTFSDGTTIPYGSFLSVAGMALHYDQENYDNAADFDGFRFSRVRDERGDRLGNDQSSAFNRQMVTTSDDYLSFGHGRHACPGRFFATIQLKTMLAHLLINYDIKGETHIRPPDIRSGLFQLPNPRGKIWIRKRE
ncbi:cytochrome P450 [Mycena sp. CBHHK59/15]|nr:cytochrome P450 [Mycena sp. CBHHK59/15]